MRKIALFLSVLICVFSIALLVGCGGEKKQTAELAVVTDVGQLMDGGFNQGTYEGVKQYAEANNKSINRTSP